MAKMFNALRAMDDFSAHRARIAAQDARMPEPIRAVMSDSHTAPAGPGHATCPRCGASNGPFERLGSGVCTACLSKSVRRQKRGKRASAR